MYSLEEITKIAYHLFEEGESREFLCKRLAELNLMLDQVFPDVNFLAEDEIAVVELKIPPGKVELKKSEPNRIQYFADSIFQSTLTIPDLHWLIAERKYLLKKIIPNIEG